MPCQGCGRCYTCGVDVRIGPATGSIPTVTIVGSTTNVPAKLVACPECGTQTPTVYFDGDPGVGC